MAKDFFPAREIADNTNTPIQAPIVSADNSAIVERYKQKDIEDSFSKQEFPQPDDLLTQLFDDESSDESDGASRAEGDEAPMLDGQGAPPEDAPIVSGRTPASAQPGDAPTVSGQVPTLDQLSPSAKTRMPEIETFLSKAALTSPEVAAYLSATTPEQALAAKRDLGQRAINDPTATPELLALNLHNTNLRLQNLPQGAALPPDVLRDLLLLGDENLPAFISKPAQKILQELKTKRGCHGEIKTAEIMLQSEEIGNKELLKQTVSQFGTGCAQENSSERALAMQRVYRLNREDPTNKYAPTLSVMEAMDSTIKAMALAGDPKAAAPHLESLCELASKGNLTAQKILDDLTTLSKSKDTTELLQRLDPESPASGAVWSLLQSEWKPNDLAEGLEVENAREKYKDSPTRQTLSDLLQQSAQRPECETKKQFQQELLTEMALSSLREPEQFRAGLLDLKTQIHMGNPHTRQALHSILASPITNKPSETVVTSDSPLAKLTAKQQQEVKLEIVRWMQDFSNLDAADIYSMTAAVRGLPGSAVSKSVQDFMQKLTNPDMKSFGMFKDDLVVKDSLACTTHKALNGLFQQLQIEGPGQKDVAKLFIAAANSPHNIDIPEKWNIPGIPFSQQLYKLTRMEKKPEAIQSVLAEVTSGAGKQNPAVKDRRLSGDASAALVALAKTSNTARYDVLERLCCSADTTGDTKVNSKTLADVVALAPKDVPQFVVDTLRQRMLAGDNKDARDAAAAALEQMIDPANYSKEVATAIVFHKVRDWKHSDNTAGPDAKKAVLDLLNYASKSNDPAQKLLFVNAATKSPWDGEVLRSIDVDRQLLKLSIDNPDVPTLSQAAMKAHSVRGLLRDLGQSFEDSAKTHDIAVNGYKRSTADIEKIMVMMAAHSQPATALSLDSPNIAQPIKIDATKLKVDDISSDLLRSKIAGSTEQDRRSLEITPQEFASLNSYTRGNLLLSVDAKSPGMQKRLADLSNKSGDKLYLQQAISDVVNPHKPLEALAKQLGAATPDKDLDALMRKALTNNSPEQVKDILCNLSSYNALGSMRRDLTGSTAKLKEGESLTLAERSISLAAVNGIKDESIRQAILGTKNDVPAFRIDLHAVGPINEIAFQKLPQFLQEQIDNPNNPKSACISQELLKALDANLQKLFIAKVSAINVPDLAGKFISRENFDKLPTDIRSALNKGDLELAPTLDKLMLANCDIDGATLRIIRQSMDTDTNASELYLALCGTLEPMPEDIKLRDLGSIKVTDKQFNNLTPQQRIEITRTEVTADVDRVLGQMANGTLGAVDSPLAGLTDPYFQRYLQKQKTMVDGKSWKHNGEAPGSAEYLKALRDNITNGMPVWDGIYSIPRDMEQASKDPANLVLSIEKQLFILGVDLWLPIFIDKKPINRGINDIAKQIEGPSAPIHTESLSPKSEHEKRQEFLIQKLRTFEIDRTQKQLETQDFQSQQTALMLADQAGKYARRLADGDTIKAAEEAGKAFLWRRDNPLMSSPQLTRAIFNPGAGLDEGLLKKNCRLQNLPYEQLAQLQSSSSKPPVATGFEVLRLLDSKSMKETPETKLFRETGLSLVDKDPAWQKAQAISEKLNVSVQALGMIVNAGARSEQGGYVGPKAVLEAQQRAKEIQDMLGEVDVIGLWELKAAIDTEIKQRREKGEDENVATTTELKKRSAVMDQLLRTVDKDYPPEILRKEKETELALLRHELAENTKDLRNFLDSVPDWAKPVVEKVSTQIGSLATDTGKRAEQLKALISAAEERTTPRAELERCLQEITTKTPDTWGTWLEKDGIITGTTLLATAAALTALSAIAPEAGVPLLVTCMTIAATNIAMREAMHDVQHDVGLRSHGSLVSQVQEGSRKVVDSYGNTRPYGLADAAVDYGEEFAMNTAFLTAGMAGGHALGVTLRSAIGEMIGNDAMASLVDKALWDTALKPGSPFLQHLKSIVMFGAFTDVAKAGSKMAFEAAGYKPSPQEEMLLDLCIFVGLCGAMGAVSEHPSEQAVKSPSAARTAELLRQAALRGYQITPMENGGIRVADPTGKVILKVEPKTDTASPKARGQGAEQRGRLEPVHPQTSPDRLPSPPVADANSVKPESANFSLNEPDHTYLLSDAFADARKLQGSITSELAEIIYLRGQITETPTDPTLTPTERGKIMESSQKRLNSFELDAKTKELVARLEGDELFRPILESLKDLRTSNRRLDAVERRADKTKAELEKAIEEHKGDPEKVKQLKEVLKEKESQFKEDEELLLDQRDNAEERLEKQRKDLEKNHKDILRALELEYADARESYAPRKEYIYRNSGKDANSLDGMKVIIEGDRPIKQDTLDRILKGLEEAGLRPNVLRLRANPMHPAGQKLQNFELMINEEGPRLIGTVDHECGHLIDFEMVRKLPPSTQKSIELSYQNSLDKALRDVANLAFGEAELHAFCETEQELDAMYDHIREHLTDKNYQKLYSAKAGKTDAAYYYGSAPEIFAELAALHCEEVRLKAQGIEPTYQQLVDAVAYGDRQIVIRHFEEHYKFLKQQVFEPLRLRSEVADTYRTTRGKEAEYKLKSALNESDGKPETLTKIADEFAAQNPTRFRQFLVDHLFSKQHGVDIVNGAANIDTNPKLKETYEAYQRLNDPTYDPAEDLTLSPELRSQLSTERARCLTIEVSSRSIFDSRMEALAKDYMKNKGILPDLPKGPDGQRVDTRPAKYKSTPQKSEQPVEDSDKRKLPPVPPDSKTVTPKELRYGRLKMGAQPESGLDVEAISWAYLSTEKGEQRVIIHTLEEGVGKKIEDIEERIKHEQAAHDISNKLNLANEQYPQSVVRDVEAFKRIDGTPKMRKALVMDAVGEGFHRQARQVTQRATGDKSIDATIGHCTKDPWMRTQIENALVERMVLGDIDFWDPNFVVRYKDGKPYVQNIDMGQAFCQGETPRFETSTFLVDDVMSPIMRTMSEQPLQSETIGRLREFLQKYDNADTRSDLARKHSLTPKQVDEMFSRCRWLADHQQFPKLINPESQPPPPAKGTERKPIKPTEKVEPGTPSKVATKVAEAKRMAKQAGLPEEIIDEKTFAVGNVERGRGQFDNEQCKITVAERSVPGTTRHEIDHMDRAIWLTALRQADRASFDELVLRSCLNNVGNGQARVFERNNAMRRDVRPALSDNNKQLLRSAIREHLSNSTNGDTKESMRIVLENPKYASLLSEYLSGIDGATHELAKEVSHYRLTMQQSLLPDASINGNQVLKDCIARRAGNFQKSDDGLMSDPRMKKYTCGLSDDTTALLEKRFYIMGSPQEIKADTVSQVEDIAQFRLALRQSGIYLSAEATRDFIKMECRDSISNIGKQRLKHEIQKNLDKSRAVEDAAEKAKAREDAEKAAIKLLLGTDADDQHADLIVQFLVDQKLVSRQQVGALKPELEHLLKYAP
ncbi:MAG: hypothetical protein K2X93_21975 [Candidatus Obscuribacterales bacterium]|nr:hypothetical protein [Candidatus Obscuribacterales bacterium]